MLRESVKVINISMWLRGCIEQVKFVFVSKICLCLVFQYIRNCPSLREVVAARLE